jgi:hypothetical protein
MAPKLYSASQHATAASCDATFTTAYMRELPAVDSPYGSLDTRFARRVGNHRWNGAGDPTTIQRVGNSCSS